MRDRRHDRVDVGAAMKQDANRRRSVRHARQMQRRLVGAVLVGEAEARKHRHQPGVRRHRVVEPRIDRGTPAQQRDGKPRQVQNGCVVQVRPAVGARAVRVQSPGESATERERGGWRPSASLGALLFNVGKLATQIRQLRS